MPRYKTVVPAYGRDYKTTSAALASWHAGEDWLISDFHDPADGKPINKQDAARDGLKVILRFDGHRKTADASRKPPKPRAKASPTRARTHHLTAIAGEPVRRDICPSRDGAAPHLFQDGRCSLCFAPASGRGSHYTKPGWGEVEWFSGDELLGRTPDARLYLHGRARGVAVGYQKKAKEFIGAHQDEDLLGRRFAFDRHGRVVMSNPGGRGPRVREGDLIRLEAQDFYAGLKAGQIGLVIGMGGPGGAPDPMGHLVYAEWDNGKQTSTFRRSVVRVGRVTPRKVKMPRFSTAGQERAAVVNDLREQFRAWIKRGGNR